MTTCRNFIDGKWSSHSGCYRDVRNKYSQQAIAEVTEADMHDVDAAVASALGAFERGSIGVRRRMEIFSRAADLLGGRAAEFARWIVAEGGQTVAEANREVTRAVEVLRLCAEEAVRMAGELIPVEGAAGGAGKLAWTARHPLGVVCAIVPFNSPLNTPLHKIGPALAAGNAVICKPASATPVSASLLAEIFIEAGLPPGWLNVVNGPGQSVGDLLMRDQRIAFYHFTGSTEVGRRLSQHLGLRRSSLELGSIAATIICKDADLGRAIEETARASFAKAGQVCTSTQVIFVEAPVIDEVCDGISAAARRLRIGDPAESTTDIGPLISTGEAERVETWVAQARSGGAKVLSGGRRQGASLEPTVLREPAPDSDVVCREVFGPVVSVMPIATIDEAIQKYNETGYGLSAGIFSSDIGTAFKAASRLRTGTLHVNAPSSSRLDLLPFGGVRNSGHGKEGPKYAIREMTEERLIVLHNVVQ